MTEFEPIDWERRLRDAITKTRASRERRRNERTEFTRRRNYGLEQRHARKLARLRQDQGDSQ